MESVSSDSVAWQRVLSYVVSALGTELVRASADPQAQPWDLRVLTDDPQRGLLEAQLRTILRIRAVSSTDSIFHSLELGR